MPPSRRVLVEDTLVHQKAARSIGMQTVWMQRWMRRAAAVQRKPLRHGLKPAYADRRVRGLGELLR